MLRGGWRRRLERVELVRQFDARMGLLFSMQKCGRWNNLASKTGSSGSMRA
jgi:hypothetical protein